MNDQQLFALAHRSLWPFYRVLVDASPGASLLEFDGVQVALTPSTPDRSILNGVVYDNSGALIEQIDRIASTYEQAGISAWTVWVPAQDGEVAAALERAGNRLDAAPAAMAVELAERLPDNAGGRPDIETTDDIAAVCALNDHAYGYSDPNFAKALNKVPEGMRFYAIRENGEMISCIATMDIDGDCAIYMVATHAEARGRGLAGRLMARALDDAVTRGCKTTSLQSTKLGYPVYRRLGYKDLGSIQMWERRTH